MDQLLLQEFLQIKKKLAGKLKQEFNNQTITEVLPNLQQQKLELKFKMENYRMFIKQLKI